MEGKQTEIKLQGGPNRTEIRSCVIAAFHSAPPNQPVPLIFREGAIEPAVVPRAAQKIDARFPNRLGQIRCVDNGEISIVWRVADTAALIFTVVTRHRFVASLARPLRALGVIAHYVAVSWTEWLDCIIQFLKRGVRRHCLKRWANA